MGVRKPEPMPDAKAASLARCPGGSAEPPAPPLPELLWSLPILLKATGCTPGLSRLCLLVIEQRVELLPYPVSQMLTSTEPRIS